jgi:WD40 repeat protein
MVSVYLSSTYSDLKTHRSSVIGALRRMKHHVICMEDYGAADNRPLDKCLGDVTASDIYVGLFAWRYGFMPTHDNPGGRSITELEYRRALELKKTCLIFLLDSNQAWPPALMDQGKDRARLDALRDELSKRHLVGFFCTESDLTTHVATALHNALADGGGRVKAKEEPTAPPQTVTNPPLNVNLAGLQRAFPGHAEAVECVAVSLDGRKGVSGGWDKNIRIWDLEGGRLVVRLEGHGGTLTHPGVVHQALFAENDRQIVSCGYDGLIRVWDIASGRQLRELAGHEGSVNAMALAADGRTLVSGGSDGSVRVWDLVGYRSVRKLTGHRGAVRSVAISDDGRTALSGGNDGELRLWDVGAGREIPRFRKRGNTLLSVDLAPDSSLALSADIDGNIRSWDVESGLEIRRFGGHAQSVRAAILSRDLRMVLSGGNDGTMRLWDASSGEEIARYDDHRCAVMAVAMSREATIALSGAADHLVRLWRLPRLEER